ncbi:unnamed protein product, partial [Bubo scandiacus]
HIFSISTLRKPLRNTGKLCTKGRHPLFFLTVGKMNPPQPLVRVKSKRKGN